MSGKDKPISTILNFINEIGIKSSLHTIEENTFLPGLKIHYGTLLIDLDQIKHPGDILHEAGHLALMDHEELSSISGNVMEGKDPATDVEMAVMIWSYAASIHLDLSPEIVFHSDGYKGESEMIIQSYESGNFFGLPILVWMELCTYESFPKMNKWTRVPHI